MRHSPYHITLLADQRQELEHRVRCTTVSSGAAARASIILRFADGQPILHIARELQLTRPVVRKWITRFIAKGLDGLHDLPRSGRRPSFSPGGRNTSGQNGLRVAG
jgi:hypothetical protein